MIEQVSTRKGTNSFVRVSMISRASSHIKLQMILLYMILSDK